MKTWPDAEPPDPRLLEAAMLEKSIQQQAVTGLTLLGFHVADMSQGRPTRQRPGIFDLYLIHPEWQCVGWCEMKVPLLLEPGVRKAYRQRQEQGLRSYEQEMWQALHRALQQPCIHAYTADSADEAIAYWAWAGYPVPPTMYRYPYQPERDARFVDPKARPRAWSARSTGRKTPVLYRRKRSRP